MVHKLIEIHREKMPKKPLEQCTTLRKTTTFCLPSDFDIKAIAKKLNLTQGKLIRIAIREYAISKGISI